MKGKKMTTSGNGMVDGADFGEGELAEVNARDDWYKEQLQKLQRYGGNQVDKLWLLAVRELKNDDECKVTYKEAFATAVEKLSCELTGHQFDSNDICTVCGQTKAEQGE